MSERDLLLASLDSLERCGCQFWACDGPTLDPVAMATCHRCATLAELRSHLGQPVIHLEETRLYADAMRIRRDAADSHRSLTIDEALTTAKRQLID